MAYRFCKVRAMHSTISQTTTNHRTWLPILPYGPMTFHTTIPAGSSYLNASVIWFVLLFMKDDFEVNSKAAYGSILILSCSVNEHELIKNRFPLRFGFINMNDDLAFWIALKRMKWPESCRLISRFINWGWSTWYGVVFLKFETILSYHVSYLNKWLYFNYFYTWIFWI